MPRENHIRAEQDILLQAWQCAFSEKSITYLSGPITTGPRLLSWYKRVGRFLGPQSEEYRQSLRLHVIAPNERALQDTARALRKHLGGPVLEPASLHVEGWTQRDYHTLWIGCIQRFAARVVLMPGWEYSSGSVVEFGAAVVASIPVESVAGEHVDAERARAKITNAVKAMVDCGVPVTELKSVLTQLAVFGATAAD